MSWGLSKSLPFEKARHFINKATHLVIVWIEASTLFWQWLTLFCKPKFIVLSISVNLTWFCCCCFFFLLCGVLSLSWHFCTCNANGSNAFVGDVFFVVAWHYSGWATWSSERGPCSYQGDWIRWSLKVPPHPNCSVILWLLHKFRFYFQVSICQPSQHKFLLSNCQKVWEVSFAPFITPSFWDTD